MISSYHDDLDLISLFCLMLVLSLKMSMVCSHFDVNFAKTGVLDMHTFTVVVGYQCDPLPCLITIKFKYQILEITIHKCETILWISQEWRRVCVLISQYLLYKLVDCCMNVGFIIFVIGFQVMGDLVLTLRGVVSLSEV